MFYDRAYLKKRTFCHLVPINHVYLKNQKTQKKKDELGKKGQLIPLDIKKIDKIIWNLNKFLISERCHYHIKSNIYQPV